MSTQQVYDNDCNIIDKNSEQIESITSQFDNKIVELENEKNKIAEMVKQLKEKEDF